MNKILTLLLGLVPLGILRKILLNLIGHKISYSSKLGINILLAEEIILKPKSRIGFFNFIKNKKIVLEENAFIKNLNYFKGPFDIFLGIKSGISNNNKFRRGDNRVSVGDASLYLGKNTFIVSNHFIDLTKGVYFGNNSILAGINSQLWTHGYYHADTGISRARIDGDIKIGDNVYIGSGCIFNPGVTIGNAIHLGAGSVVSKDLTEPGMHVNQPLRYIDNNLDTVKSKLNRIEGHDLVEEVYEKPQK
ncbi:hypothetical protein J4050_00610 [Winogradskyella sp. DF17]|uniref:Acyltransferase n=1 Tax=Winogradskyella pelagia TaxID=2819984 RepID=A0ABS3SZZ1_9FLAO|nr:DapH/DapD/GlmU-related protein [Winogradskyella sp. DF17]MBO3115226.1 hypothetical protein [Winogradskyella sp. DF17]